MTSDAIAFIRGLFTNVSGLFNITYPGTTVSILSIMLGAFITAFIIRFVFKFLGASAGLGGSFRSKPDRMEKTTK